MLQATLQNVKQFTSIKRCSIGFWIPTKTCHVLLPEMFCSLSSTLLHHQYCMNFLLNTKDNQLSNSESHLFSPKCLLEVSFSHFSTLKTIYVI